MMCTPCRSSNAFISAGGQAEPPTTTSRSDETSIGGRVRLVEVGEQAASRSSARRRRRCGFCGRDHRGQRLGVQEAVGHDHARRRPSTRRTGRPHAMRVEHGYDGQHPIAGVQREPVRPCRPASSAGRSTGGCRRRPWGCRSCRSCSTWRPRRAPRRPRPSRRTPAGPGMQVLVTRAPPASSAIAAPTCRRDR